MTDNGLTKQQDSGLFQLTNYANFRIFTETLLTSPYVREPRYEAAIMEYTRGLAKWAGDHLSKVWKTRVLNGDEDDERNSMVNVEVPASAEECGGLVKKLHDEDGLYVIGSTAASGPYPSVPGFKCFFRLSAQVYLERSDFVRLGEAVLKRVAAE